MSISYPGIEVHHARSFTPTAPTDIGAAAGFALDGLRQAAVADLQRRHGFTDLRTRLPRKEQL